MEKRMDMEEKILLIMNIREISKMIKCMEKVK